MFQIQNFIVVLFLMAFAPAGAQILNVDKRKLDPKEDSANYMVVDLSASVQAYNRSAGVDDPVNLFGYNFGGDAGFIGKSYSLMLINKYDYLQINDGVFLNAGYSHFRSIFKRQNRLNYEGFAQYQYDNFRGLHPRLLAGGGFRLTIIDNERFALRLGMGGMYEYEEWDEPYRDERVYMNLVKSTNYAIVRWSINDYVKINTICYFQTGYDDNIEAFRNRVSGELNLNVNLTERLRYTGTFMANYEDKPIVPITGFIYSLTNGVSFTF